MAHRKRRRLLIALPLAVALCASGARAEPETAPVPSALQRASLHLDAPAPGAQLRLVAPVVQVRGRAGAELFDADVAIVLDASNSALLASGNDLDADGVVGATRAFAEDAGRFATSHAAWTTDGDDSILRAELVASRALIDALAERRDRIGLLTYTSQPRVRVEVGSPEDARRALDAVPIAEDRTGTDVSRALRHAALLLERAPRPALARPRAILLASDGEPTVPNTRYDARQRALREAAKLAEQGVALYVLAFGAHLDEERGEDDLAFLRALAEAGSGVLVRVESPARLLEDLPPAEAQPALLEIVNLTTGEPARSLHVSPDGRFDALLPLTPGENELRVRASWRDGRGASVSRSVHYEVLERTREGE